MCIRDSLISHRDNLIIDAGIQHIGDEASADPLEHVGSRRLSAEHRRGGGFHRHNPHLGIFLLQISSNAGDGAAGAHTGHKGIYCAAVSYTHLDVYKRQH